MHPGEDHEARYDRATMALHWATVLLVVALYALAQLWDFAPRGSAARLFMRSSHMSLGLTLALVLLARIAWRVGPARRLPPAGHGLLDRAARAMHWLLYALLIAIVGLGISARWADQAPLGFFGLFTIPPLLPVGKAQFHTLRELHNLVANAILALGGLHAAAALLHHYVLRDGVLRRMLPSRHG